ncbi:MAG: hypothetical protein JO285_09430 [Kutzneria sp.]|nr:hypothetical protein [Kutzneria sp.]
MGLFTVSKDTPTLRAKAMAKVTAEHAKRGGAVCEVCRKPIAGSVRKANMHPRCARTAAADY